jgi:uncharacterized membrane protein YedE/YeeE
VRRLVPFVSGLLFALGLGLAGMTVPAKVIGFLDVFGRWDPSLAFVMGGALLVYLPAVQWLRRSGRAPRAAEGTGGTQGMQGMIDTPLVLGAALFGVGWGLSGLCPGPALVSLAGGGGGVIVFGAGMFGGLALAGRMRSDEAAAGCEAM